MKNQNEIQAILISAGINTTFFKTKKDRQHYKVAARYHSFIPTTNKQLDFMYTRLTQGHPFGSLSISDQEFLSKLCDFYNEKIEFVKGNTVAQGNKVVKNGLPLYNALKKLINE